MIKQLMTNKSSFGEYGHETGHNQFFPSTTPTQPKIQTNQAGVNINTGQTTFDKVLATITSMTAMFRNQPYVPTTVHPVNNQVPNYQNPNANDAALLAYLQQQSTLGNAGAGLENFIKNNTGLLLAGGAALALFMSGRK